MSDIAIQFENISKQYRLGVVGTGTISHDLNRWWHLVRGKEDPYLKVGQVNDRSLKATSDYVWALKDINFEVKQGDVVGIIGKNGAGKSTLLKILSRVTSPSTGSIKAKGRIASLLEVGTGFHPELTGRENIYMNGAIMGMTKSEITRKLDEIVDFAGVEMYIDTPAKRYSSGMTVRLGFAIAAHLEPEILVVDEVLAVGDAEFQKKAIGKMQDVSQGEGRTVLFVSHQLNSIRNLCENCVLLDNGSVSMYDVTDSVITKYLSSNYHFNNSREWVNLNGEFLDEYCSLQSLSIVDENGVVIENGITRNDQQNYIKFQFDIDNVYNSALCIGYCLYSSNEELIYCSYETDASEAEKLMFNKGSNVLFAKLPVRVLNEGDYIVKPSISLYCQRWIINQDERSPHVTFSIQGGLSDSLFWQNKRSGIIAPLLPFSKDIWTSNLE